jgi:hypothetical protein
MEHGSEVEQSLSIEQQPPMWLCRQFPVDGSQTSSVQGSESEQPEHGMQVLAPALEWLPAAHAWHEVALAREE